MDGYLVVILRLISCAILGISAQAVVDISGRWVIELCYVAMR